MMILSALNLEKWIHSFVQNLTFHVSPICNKKLDKINFMYYLDVDYRTNFELLAEILKDIARKSTLDMTDVQSVRHFIERQTKFLDKCVYSENTLLSMYHNNHINNKIVQSIRGIKTNVNTRKQTTVFGKTKSVKLRGTAVNDLDQLCNITSMRTLISDQSARDSLLTKSRDICLKNHDVTKSVIAHVRQEAILNKRYLQLYMNDVEFMKSVQITLYIASKQNKKRIDYQHVLMLCKHAILCLIDPSEKAFVYVENNLSHIIQNYLLQGCVRHFDATSNPKNYSALLILSERAKLLVRHPNIIMLRAISAILRCNIHDVLVLSRPFNEDCILKYEEYI